MIEVSMMTMNCAAAMRTSPFQRREAGTVLMSVSPLRRLPAYQVGWRVRVRGRLGWRLWGVTRWCVAVAAPPVSLTASVAALDDHCPTAVRPAADGDGRGQAP